MPQPRDPEESGQREGGTEGEGEREKTETFPQGKKRRKKRQQYIKCFFFNETNPKDVQSGSSCAVHKHGENKQNDRVETGGVNPRRGWTCHQEGFSWTGPGPGPRGWAQAQQAQASLHSAPGWLASLCPHFHEYPLLPSDRRSPPSWLPRSSFSAALMAPDLPCRHQTWHLQTWPRKGGFLQVSQRCWRPFCSSSQVVLLVHQSLMKSWNHHLEAVKPGSCSCCWGRPP